MENLKSWGSHGPPWHPPNSAYLHEYMNIVYIYSLLYAGTIFFLLYIVIYLYFTFFYLDDLYLNKIEMILLLFFFKMLWLRANLRDPVLTKKETKRKRRPKKKKKKLLEVVVIFKVYEYGSKQTELSIVLI